MHKNGRKITTTIHRCQFLCHLKKCVSLCLIMRAQQRDTVHRTTDLPISAYMMNGLWDCIYEGICYKTVTDKCKTEGDFLLITNLFLFTLSWSIEGWVTGLGAGGWFLWQMARRLVWLNNDQFVNLLIIANRCEREPFVDPVKVSVSGSWTDGQMDRWTIWLADSLVAGWMERSIHPSIHPLIDPLIYR